MAQYSFGIEKQLTPFAHELSQALTASVWATALSITGKGELKRAIVLTPNGFSQIRVTIDGTIVHHTIQNYAGSNGGAATGLMQESDQGMDTTNTFRGRNPGVLPAASFTNYVRTYPSTSGLLGVVILSGGIPFKNSLLVEILSSTNETVALTTIQGGTY